MPHAITMPRLSDTMEEGTIIKWHVAVGDKVASGDVLADIETDKATMEMNSFEDGEVAMLGLKEGEAASIGQLVVLLAESGETADEAIAKAKEAGDLDGGAKAEPGDSGDASGGGDADGNGQSAPSSPAPTPAAEPVAIGGGGSAPTASSGGGRLRVSPVARKMAEEAGLNLAAVTGTGPDGRIIKRDVKAAIEAGPTAPAAAPAAATATAAAPAPKAPRGYSLPAPQPLAAKTIAVSNKRKTIAKRLLESKQTIPHFTVTVGVDAEPILAIRKQVNTALSSQGVKLSVNDFVVKGVAQALVRHPMINSSWSDSGIVMHGAVNVGVAVAIPLEQGGGLVVPTLRNADSKPIKDISAETKYLAKKSRGEGLTIEEMSDGTFTVSNLGMFGVDHFEAIINPPQGAILAVGAAVEKPVVRNGELAVGTEMTCTLSADHRVIDGAMAAEFLQTLKYLLEHPAACMV